MPRNTATDLSCAEVRAPLKWAGGKRLVLSKIQEVLPTQPEHRHRFIEPFMGSGVVYLNMPGYTQYLLGDSNHDLIDLYVHIWHNTAELLAQVDQLYQPAECNSSEYYYDMREDFNTCPDGTLRRAAMFIYLNRHGFNGMCRYNKKGWFNIPFGKQALSHKPTEAILCMAKTFVSRPATLHALDFRNLLACAGRGDTVYLDPPYLPLSDTAKFHAYHTAGFELASRAFPLLVAGGLRRRVSGA